MRFCQCVLQLADEVKMRKEAQSKINSTKSELHDATAMQEHVERAKRLLQEELDAIKVTLSLSDRQGSAHSRTVVLL